MRKINLTVIVFSFFLFSSMAAAPADTLYVPTVDYPTIQSAINATINGDEVVVADGTYTGAGNRDLSFQGNAITVRSANGPAGCIIDCQASPSDIHRAFSFQNAEGSDSILQGFTIRNGCQQQGGGIYCDADSSPTITGCVFEDNTMSSIYTGGAIFALSSVTITGCSFTGNQGFIGGGAIHCSGGSPTISGNIISGNTGSGGNGGGILIESTIGAVVSGNVISGNTATYGAGLALSNCTDIEVSANVIAGNTATVGAGVWAHAITGIFLGNTFVGNTAGSAGGALYCKTGSAITMSNEIFWGNSAGSAGPGMFIASTGGASTVGISCSDVDGGPASCTVFSPSVLNWGANMFEIDPVFCDAANGDYTLAASSGCLAAHQPICGLVGAKGEGCGPQTIGASMECVPDNGVVPFDSQMTARLTNLCIDQSRRIAGRINVTLGGGNSYTNWKGGFTNLSPGTEYQTSWPQNIPALGSVIGDNLFVLEVEDVTPSPYNQPPYWPAGNTDSTACTVTALQP